MNYGYFDDKNREYVITNPCTPVKWINYIGTLEFGGLLDHTGGSLLCRRDPALNRIVRYLHTTPASDFRGETLYIRLKEKGNYRVYSPFFVPTLDPLDAFECRVGLGYSRFVAEYLGIRTDVLVFVPGGTNCELRRIRLTNLRETPLNADVIPVVEFTHFDALKQYNNADWVPQTMQSRAFPETGGTLVLSQFAFMHRDTRINYTASSHPVDSFETDRARFLGRNEYGTFKDPLSLHNTHLSNYEALRGDNLHAMLHRLETILPGETREIIFQLGQAESIGAAMPVIERFRQSDNVELACAELKGWWESYLEHLQVETPAADVNTLLNIHNPRQCYITKQWSRYLSLYQTGLGVRGLGFRDSSQDILGIMDRVPEEGRALIEKLLSVQKRNGSAMHQFNPMTMEGSVGDSHEVEGAPDYYGDDHLWVILSVCAYLKETGDLAFLDRELPYYEKDRSEKPLESGSVFDHMCRAIEFTHGDRGAHGLPLLGFADWNDTVNLKKGAESFFIACLFGTALREMAELLDHMNESALLRRYRGYYDEMKEVFDAAAWDGEWFLRYLDHDGSPIGSRKNEKGQIYLNGQSWAILAAFADEERLRRAMDAVYEKLNTKDGIKLSAPGYNGYDPGKGGITTYPPGAKENGGIFLHANTWAVIAETMLGRGGRAFEYYSQLNPVMKNTCIDTFECEPYVYPQNILGDEHPQAGLARNSWLSGTSAWMYTAATRYILGIRPEYDGLRIDPCIPAEWDGFRVERLFRGTRIRIFIRNPDHLCRGIVRLAVNGQQIPGNLLSVEMLQGKDVEIEAILACNENKSAEEARHVSAACRS